MLRWRPKMPKAGLRPLQITRQELSLKPPPLLELLLPEEVPLLLIKSKSAGMPY